MGSLSEIATIKSWIKDALSDISQANGYNYTVQMVEDMSVLTDHVVPPVSVALAFQIINTTFDTNLIDQGYAAQHAVFVIMYIRNGQQNEIYSLADDVLRAFARHESTRYLTWQPVSVDYEDIFSDEGHFARGTFQLSIIQPINLIAYQV